MTLLPRLHLSLPPGAQPSGLTSAKCVLKRGEGPFHHHTPPPPTLTPTLPPRRPLLCLPPLCPLSLSHTHSLAGWRYYRYTGRIYGVRAHGKNKKASVNTCGKHSSSSSFHWRAQPHYVCTYQTHRSQTCLNLTGIQPQDFPD